MEGSIWHVVRSAQEPWWVAEAVRVQHCRHFLNTEASGEKNGSDSATGSAEAVVLERAKNES